MKKKKHLSAVAEKNAAEELDDFLSAITAPGVITSATIPSPLEDDFIAKKSTVKNKPKQQQKTTDDNSTKNNGKPKHISNKPTSADLSASTAARVRITKKILVGLQMAFKQESRLQEIIDTVGLLYLKDYAPEILEFINGLPPQK